MTRPVSVRLANGDDPATIFDLSAGLQPRTLCCWDCKDLLDPWEHHYCAPCAHDRLTAADLRAFEIPVDNRRLRS